MKNNVAIPDRVKSDKIATRAVGMSLASNDRSVKREIFEQAMKDKEQKQAEEKMRQELERVRQEEEEVKRIRAMSNFRATPIMKYKNNLGEVAFKKLTVPVEPKLETRVRAAFNAESGAVFAVDDAENDKQEWISRVNIKWEYLEWISRTVDIELQEINQNDYYWNGLERRHLYIHPIMMKFIYKT